MWLEKDLPVTRNGGMESLCPKLDPKHPISPRLIVLSAPSGAGKSTLCEQILKDFPDMRMSISSTTRPKRPYEREGIHYHFLTLHEFKARRDLGEFAEWARVHNHCYGTPKSHIEKWLAENRHVLFDIDVHGAIGLLKHFGARVILIFIHPPSMEALKERLLKRKTESPRSIERRLQNAYNELGWSQKFDYQITNDDLNRAYQELKEIVKKECP